jgi:hypothetical protein
MPKSEEILRKSIDSGAQAVVAQFQAGPPQALGSPDYGLPKCEELLRKSMDSGRQAVCSRLGVVGCVKSGVCSRLCVVGCV